MRVIITSPPKMGNQWIKCLLCHVYDLKLIGGQDSPDTNIQQFEQFVQQGRFPDSTIFHQHCRYKPPLCDLIDEIPVHLVTIVRDPYDAFVSMYYWIQTRTDSDRAQGRVRSKRQPARDTATGLATERPRNTMVGKPIDDPLVLQYLANDYGTLIERAAEWVQSGRAIVVRYEDLHSDPVGALTLVTSLIEPVGAARVEQAIEACSIDNMRKKSKRRPFHVRTGNVGESRETLSEPHLSIFRENYSDLISSLGYEVR
jgi:Sulfotransferase domain